MHREPVNDDSPESSRLGELDERLGALFDRHSDRLRRLVAFRIDGRLRGRLDPSDVVQETFLEASERFDSFRTEPPMPEFLWLRLLALQRLARLHRHHLGVQGRDAGREVGLGRPDGLADDLMGSLTTPSQAAMRAEQVRRLRHALETLEPIDYEVLVLRHFEQLSNAESARVLGLGESAASNRYVRALERLRAALSGDQPAPGERCP
jgi:RNA polymerase sigma-70 factor (ECF subfamily)